MTCYPPGHGPHDPRTCRWIIVKQPQVGVPGLWQCEHGWTSDHHPNGWCNGGCCR